MSNSALHVISSINSLRQAWSYINSNSSGKSRNTSGCDEESINDFAANADRNLRELQCSIRSLSGYKFNSLKAHLIPKPNGKERVICVPTVRDRIVQRAILDYLSDGDKCKVENKVSYGFVKGRNVKAAVSRAKNLRSRKKWVYKTDITSFFDEIDRDILIERITRHVRSHSLHKLLVEATKCEIYEPSTHKKKRIRQQGIIEEKGVRQGMPMSPFFANLILRGFDKTVEKKDFKMVRYADDFIICAKNENECIEIHQFCKNELYKIGHTIPEIEDKTKTVIYKPSEAAEFLGVGLVPYGSSYLMQVMPKQLQSIVSKILHLSNFDNLVQKNITLSKLNKHLEGVIGGYMGSYKYVDNREELEISLIEAQMKVLTKIYRDGLGINIEGLSSMQRKFLGI